MSAGMCGIKDALAPSSRSRVRWDRFTGPNAQPDSRRRWSRSSSVKTRSISDGKRPRGPKFQLPPDPPTTQADSFGRRHGFIYSTRLSEWDVEPGPYWEQRKDLSSQNITRFHHIDTSLPHKRFSISDDASNHPRGSNSCTTLHQWGF